MLARPCDGHAPTSRPEDRRNRAKDEMWDVTRSLSAIARELRALSAERSSDFVAPGILSTLYALMTVESSIVATDAAGAIANLSNHEVTRKAIVESGGLAALSCLLSHSLLLYLV